MSIRKGFDVKHVKNMKLRSILILPIVAVIILSSSIIAIISYEKNKQLTQQAIEQQLTSSAEVMTEKVTMLRATVPKEEFDRKLAYALTLTRNNYKDNHLTPIQFKLTKTGKTENFSGFNTNIPSLPGAIEKQLHKQGKGIYHYNGVTFAFANQVELDDAIYIIALQDKEYLQPVIQYRNLLFFITLITIFIASTVGIFTIRNVTNPIIKLKETMEQVSKGNLHIRLEKTPISKELQSLALGFNQMISSVNTLLGHIEGSAKHITLSSEKLSVTSSAIKDASEQITSAISQVASGTEIQVEAASQASTNVLTISEGMEMVGESIEKVEKSLDKANEKARTGNELVEETVEQMGLVQKTIGETSEKIDALDQNSKHIDQIVNMISEIASQTNLLSLNATIEAARAGEHGKGFAVVANEIRKLADQSGNAAMNIKELTDEIRKVIIQAVDSMSRGGMVLEEGMKKVQETENAFAEIVLSISDVLNESKGVSNISIKVRDQMKTMIGNMHQISDTTEQFAGSMQYIKAATEQQKLSMDDVAFEADAFHHLALDLVKVIKMYKNDETH
ncbi:methyl-accepting chemotaxis protein [Heyndrickxia camelliae]|uniref:Methyl-accepting chemotaxis protein n=1 Tax=Heyndrickxia camelliae TaxID=1707093 RepID=A0A2N3LJH6_9BACI|nr:methyl-accepting chemotaxis protein [Heyndrickxia camelliae]PKR84782.1 methyl-accepting chemotaxis protein [Heyndrickxia camelliae]